MMNLTDLLNFTARMSWVGGRYGRHVLRLTLLASLGSLLPNHTSAQTFTTIHAFGFNHTNGMNPRGDLVISGNSLYGVTAAGGSFSNGVVFKVQTDGAGYTNLHSFSASHYNPVTQLTTNSDGINPGGSDLETPEGSLVLSSNALYGTAYSGGVFGLGTVFRVNTDGTGFTNLHTFTTGRRDSSGMYTNTDGAQPNNNLILSGNTLYGTTTYGSSSGLGAVFKLSTDGSGFTNLHAFARDGFQMLYPSNNEGAYPIGHLALAGNVLYGTALSGGRSGEGSVFRLNTDGNSFTNLHSFGAIPPPNYTNSGGATPYGGVVLSGNMLYGTTLEGGTNFFPGGDSLGTIFAIKTDGTGFTNLYNLAEFGGAYSYGGLSVAGHTLFGMTSYGGSGGGGTVFAFNTDGTGFVRLYNFTADIFPRAGAVLSGNILYGALTSYSNFGDETLFSLTLPQPQLAIVRSGTNVILTWPTNIFTFTLQAATNLASTNLWSNVSPASVVVNGQNTVTNPISNARNFYRLTQ